MNYNDIRALKEVCGVLTERYVIDIIEENNKLKKKIKELKKYEKPKIKASFYSKTDREGIYSDDYDNGILIFVMILQRLLGILLIVII